ncbi:hypothetical protein BH10PSE17_BH10PSE17_25060 [soil metagenome]
MTKKLRFLMTLLALMPLTPCVVFASTWNTFTYAYNDTSVWFFDADTVVRQGTTVTLWVKYVDIVKPDTDGSWATAMRAEISCPQKSYRVLTSSIYDKDQKFIKSNSNASQTIFPPPDSLMEEVVKVACTPAFPKDPKADGYYALAHNDIFLHASRVAEKLAESRDTAPK